MCTPISLQVRYFISDDPRPVLAGGRRWHLPLPMDRHGSGGQEVVCCGDYFDAVALFLTGDACSRLRAADDFDPGELLGIDIHMEKHGAFYHPARVVAETRAGRRLFVVNVALSAAGRESIQREYQCLEKLRAVLQAAFVPRVYALGDMSLNNRPARMMLGEWFDGYHEFHLSIMPDGKQGLCMWDPEHNVFLSLDAIRQLYHRAAYILTYYYNVETGEQIFPWHHAAGDFVVRLNEGMPELRLITVRQYASMMDIDHHDPDGELFGLLIFFLNMSIRMRLDRLDGIGEIAWAEETAASGIVSGFLAALGDKGIPAEKQGPAQLKAWTDYFAGFSDDMLLELASTIVDAYSQAAPELPLVRRRLSGHIVLLAETMRQMDADPDTARTTTI